MEPRRKVPKPLISWPVHDWHPFPAETPMGSPTSPHYGTPRKYIPGLIPAFRGAAIPPRLSERMMFERMRAADKLNGPRGYRDMVSMRKSIIASGGGAGMAVSMYLEGPNGSTFELVPPPVPLLPPSVGTKGGNNIPVNGGLSKGGKIIAPKLPQPPAPAAKGYDYYGRSVSTLATHV